MKNELEKSIEELKEKLLEKIIEELKEELLNKELTLLELDNEVQNIIGSTQSLFDCPDEICKKGSYVYMISLGEEFEIFVGYIAKNTNEEIENMKSEEKLNIIVKIDEIRKF